MDIAFFDFDGTITKDDSFFGFLVYAAGPWKFLLRVLRLFPVLVFFLMKTMPNQEAKERVMTEFFKGMNSGDFNTLAQRYAREKLPGMIRPEARKALDWHRSRQDKVVVVTASPGNWIVPWCLEQGIGIISTHLESVDGRITGKFSTPNCRGIEKVLRIREEYDISLFGTVFAYGNSRGDREMLEMADVGTYRWKKVRC